MGVGWVMLVLICLLCLCLSVVWFCLCEYLFVAFDQFWVLIDGLALVVFH